MIEDDEFKKFNDLPLGTVLSIKYQNNIESIGYFLKCYDGWYMMDRYEIYRSHHVGDISPSIIDLIILAKNDENIGLERMGTFVNQPATSKLDMDSWPPRTSMMSLSEPDKVWVKNDDGTFSLFGSSFKYESKYFVDWISQGIEWRMG